MNRDQRISCHCCYKCHSEESLLLYRPKDPVPNTSSTGLQHQALNKTIYPFHQWARRIPHHYFSTLFPFPSFLFFISLFPLSKFVFFFYFLSTKQANKAQHRHSAADLLSACSQRRGKNLHWFGSYITIPNVNPTAFMLNFALCFAFDTMQQNNVEKLFPKISSIYVPNSVTHAASDSWDEFNSIHLKCLNLRANIKCLCRRHNNGKDFIYDNYFIYLFFLICGQAIPRNHYVMFL